jgi:hypothetical protein
MPRKIRAFIASVGWVSPIFVGSLAAVAGACSASPDDAAIGVGGAVASGGAANAGAGPAVNPLGRARCVAPVGVNGSPKTTQESIELLNALPKPTSVACFLESLERPLTVYATSSQFSAQPALSSASPRVFLKLGSLWLSVVIDGKSSYLMEFGDRVVGEPLRSIKGELQLPLDEPISPSAPYDRVRYGAGTGCGLCHYSESPATGSSPINAFASVAFRPRTDTRVGVEVLRNAAATCNWQSESHRCEMLSAIFDGGVVTEEAFPEAMPTFF